METVPAVRDICTGIREATGLSVKDIIKTLGANLQTIAGLEGVDQRLLKKVVYESIIDFKKDALKREIIIQSVNYEEAKAAFIAEKGARSKHTAARYSRALSDFEAYCTEKNITPFEVKRAKASDFCHAYLSTVKGGKYSSATRASIIAAVSSFFTYCEGLFEDKGAAFINPFKHVTKIKKQAERALDFPKTKEEIDIMIQAFSPVLACITYIMSVTGLRIGAFENMQINGRKYRTVSKGKAVKGELDSTGAKMIKDLCAENPEQPFKDCDTFKLTNLFKYHTKRLAKEGRIRAAYSPHDIRHYFAWTEYQKDKDIYRVKNLLNHADIRVTEVYLREIDALAD